MRFALLAALSLAFPPSAVQAQDDEGSSPLDRDNELSFHLGGYATGATIEIDDESRVADGSGMAGVRFLHNVDRRLGLGLELNGLDAGEHKSSRLIRNAVSTTRLSSAELLALARVRFGRERLRPYLLGGLGFHTTRFELEARPQAGFVWTDTGTTEVRSLIDSAKTGAALALEAGVDCHLNRALSAGVFLGWHYQSRQTYESTAQGRGLGISGFESAFAGAALGASLTARF